MQPIHLNEKYLVVLTGSAPNYSSNWNEAIQILWKNSLIDSHVLTQDAPSSWALYIFLPYQNDCITPSRLRIELFTKSNFSNSMNVSISQLYPEKLENFNECPTYVAVTPGKRGNTIDKTIDGRYFYQGFDISLTEEIIKDLNSTLLYNMPFIQSEHGMIVKNITIAENFELVGRFISNFVKLNFKYLISGLLYFHDFAWNDR